MDIYCWVIFLYVAGTVTVGWFLLYEVGPVGPSRRGQPSLWGTYSEAEACPDCFDLQQAAENDSKELVKSSRG
jgi:hypothetical protein